MTSHVDEGQGVVPPKLIAPTEEAADGADDVSTSIGTIALVAVAPRWLALKMMTTV